VKILVYHVAFSFKKGLIQLKGLKPTSWNYCGKYHGGSGDFVVYPSVLWLGLEVKHLFGIAHTNL
jgi:hypothetical protein